MTETPSVVATHPGKHYHVYQIALAAQETGMLSKFITGIYYKPSNFPYSLSKAFPNRIRDLWTKQLETKRSMITLDARLIVSNPYFEATTLILGKLPIIRDLLGRRNLVLLNNALFDWWISKRLRREEYGILHAFYGCALHTFEQAKRNGASTVLDMFIHPLANSYVDDEYERLGGTGIPISARERKEIELADYIFAPADFVVNGLVSLGFPQERVVKIPWGVDTALFTPRNGESGDGFRILFVGNISLRKGFHYLLEAFRQLQLPGAQLTIIGDPLDKLSEQVLRQYDGLFSWIPRVPYSELHRWYQASDVFVFPSLSEGSAMVTYEAMACGLPQIVTENSGSIVRDGVDGFIVPIRDVDAIEERIRLLYYNKALARRMGQEARTSVENYTWKRYRDRVTDAYRKIVARQCVS